MGKSKKEDQSILLEGSASRSTQITIVNGTEFNLELDGQALNHGIWNGGPVGYVDKNTIRVVAQNDSDGFLTGAQGGLRYEIRADGKISNMGDLVINWDNPWAGDNSYSCRIVNAAVPLYVNYCGGSGNNASVTFVICQASNYSG